MSTRLIVFATLVAGSLLSLGAAFTAQDATTPAEGKDVIKLPEPKRDGGMSLEAAFCARRSVRSFTDKPLTIDEVGQLLFAAQGITRDGGRRAAPSAGGLYPLEIYLAAGRVDGLAAGVYKYRPESHDLLLMAEGDIRGDLSAAALGQSSVADGAVDLVFAAVEQRTSKKYGNRATRYVHIEVGHASQNVCLQAAALGLGTVTVGAFEDAKVAGVLRLQRSEAALYIMPVGRIE